jgi:hypothetical protein
MSFGEKSRFRIALTSGPVRSLCWHADELVDFAGDGTRFGLDGSTKRASINWAYRFDNAVTSRDGNYRVICETLGTKGLVLRGNKRVREINRSLYHAHVYEYLIAILDLPDGVLGLAHCPEGYNRLEIEEIESGDNLALRPDESPDFFHSRLQVSPDGAYLLSAGWVWHPVDIIRVFSIHDALKCPEHLDKPIALNFPVEFFEVNAATFQDNTALLLVGKSESDESTPSFVAHYKIKEGVVEQMCALESAPGTIMAVGRDHFVVLYEHPKLFEISTGKVVQGWPELSSGKQNSSFIWHHELRPPLALNPARKRFAVANTNHITVIQLG